MQHKAKPMLYALAAWNRKGSAAATSLASQSPDWHRAAHGSTGQELPIRAKAAHPPANGLNFLEYTLCHAVEAGSRPLCTLMEDLGFEGASLVIQADLPSRVSSGHPASTWSIASYGHWACCAAVNCDRSR